MLRVGLLGTGNMGRVHAAAWGQVQGARLAAVAGRSQARARELAARSGARAVDPAALLADPDVDVVDVCLPTDLHRDAVIEAAQAGKHVLCEKPLALTAEEGEAMVRACRQAGVRLMVGHVARYHPLFEAVREVLAAGDIGRPGVVRISQGGPPPVGAGGWPGDPPRGGGPLIDLAIHAFDFLRWTFGPVHRIFARSLTGRGLGFDYALATLRLASGVIAHVEADWSQPAGSPFSFGVEVAGSAGLYAAATDSATPLVLRRRDETGGPQPASVLSPSPYVRQLRAFARAVAAGEDPPVTGEDALESLRVALAAAESARRGQPITLTEGWAA